jgi:rfaE bifunctional protein nucleotidyltransferase chain/domain
MSKATPKESPSPFFSNEESLDWQRFVKLRTNAKVVFTNGCFDILHTGHTRYLQQAKNLGDLLVVGLNSDASVRKLKGEKRPICHEQERKELLLSLKAVDFVFIFSEETPLQLIKTIKPDILCKGGDWEKSQIIGSDFVESYNGKVFSLNFIEGHSTTNVIEKILKNYKTL